MKASELRIGNYILHNGQPIIVAALLPEDGFYDTISAITRTERDLKDCSGIPLTGEWLLKFGFHSDHHGFVLDDKMSLSFSITKDGKFLPCWLDLPLYPHAYKTIEGVHELQNLYFALTGEELKVKELQPEQ